MMTDGAGVCGTVINVPYPTRSEAESAQPPSLEKQLEGAQDTATILKLEDERAKEKARKVSRNPRDTVRCGFTLLLVAFVYHAEEYCTRI